MFEKYACCFDSFDEAFAAWVSRYIVLYGFKSFLRLPRAKYKLDYMMKKDGFLYVVIAGV